MAWLIHREKRFDKELEFLKTQGDKGRLAVRRAEEILSKLTVQGWTDLKHVAKLSFHGEHRVDGCIKYDIGSGFRMICFKRGENLYFSYVGTHDDCHRWLNRNRDRHNQVGKREAVTVMAETVEWEKNPAEEIHSEELEYEDLLLARINDQILRRIFSGLIQKQQKFSEKAKEP
jgi:hypothetical protein